MPTPPSRGEKCSALTIGQTTASLYGGTATFAEKSKSAASTAKRPKHYNELGALYSGVHERHAQFHACGSCTAAIPPRNKSATTGAIAS